MSGMGCVCSCDLALFDWRAGSCSSGTKASSPSQLLFRVVLAWTHPLFSRHPPRGALSSSTGANSGLTGTGPIVVTVLLAWVFSGPASENSTHPLRQRLSLPTSQASTRCVPVEGS